MSYMADMFKDVEITTCDKSVTVHTFKFINEDTPEVDNPDNVVREDVTFDIDQEKVARITNKGTIWPTLLNQGEKMIKNNGPQRIENGKGGDVDCNDVDFKEACSLARFQSAITGEPMIVIRLDLKDEAELLKYLRPIQGGKHKHMVSLITNKTNNRDEKKILLNFYDNFDIDYMFLNDPTKDRRAPLKKSIEKWNDVRSGVLVLPAYMAT